MCLQGIHHRAELLLQKVMTEEKADQCVTVHKERPDLDNCPRFLLELCRSICSKISLQSPGSARVCEVYMSQDGRLADWVTGLVVR